MQLHAYQIFRPCLQLVFQTRPRIPSIIYTTPIAREKNLPNEIAKSITSTYIHTRAMWALSNFKDSRGNEFSKGLMDRPTL